MGETVRHSPSNLTKKDTGTQHCQNSEDIIHRGRGEPLNINFRPRRFDIYWKVTFARNLAKKLSPHFYYLILLFQLSVGNPENFEEFKAREVLKIRKKKKQESHQLPLLR